MRLMELMAKGCGLKITRYYSQNLSKFYMDMHSHKAAEIMYVLSGKCRIFYVDGKYADKDSDYTTSFASCSMNIEEVEMKHGQFILLDPSVPHRLEIDGSLCKILCIEMEPVNTEKTKRHKGGIDGVAEDFHGGVCKELCYVDPRLFQSEEFKRLEEVDNYIFTTDESHVYGAIKDVQREFGEHNEDPSTQQMMVDGEMTRLFMEIARSYRAHNSEKYQVNTYVRKAVRYIRDNFDTEFMIEDIAKVCNINENYLQRIFKEVKGVSIVQYINRLRMDKAEMLLLNSDMSIVDIAESVGFNSRQHFGHVFQQHNNMSPKAFRQIGGYKGEVPLVE